MLYRFFISKKGLTFVELMVVVIVLGILAAVAVPIFSHSLKKQKANDCTMQREVVKTLFAEVMEGMADSGKRQLYLVGTEYVEKVDMTRVATAAHKENYPVPGSIAMPCFVLTKTDSKAFTIGDIRGGYRPDTFEDYRDGCDAGYYLKKSTMSGTKFYTLLANEEIPVCPFVPDDATEEELDTTYHYRIDEYGKVHCPYCETEGYQTAS